MRRRSPDGLSVLLVTPLFPPQVGGAATYFALLAGFLRDCEEVCRVGVIAPFCHGEPVLRRQGDLALYRLLPSRRPVRRWNLASRLAARLLSDLALVSAVCVLVPLCGYDTVHVHGNFSSVGGRVPSLLLEIALRVLRCRSILDLRDPIVPPRASGAWQETISASQAIYRRAIAAGTSATACHLLPTPIDLGAVRASATTGGAVVGRVAQGRPYVCYVGEITPAKGLRELLLAFRQVKRRSGSSNLALVLVGPEVHGSGSDLLDACDVHGDPEIFYLGQRSWEESLSVMAGAELVVAPSYPGREGMPRVCLEALALGRKVLFPSGIQEFLDACPDFVISSLDPDRLQFALQAALDRADHPTYDLDRHSHSRVFSEYVRLYRGTASRRVTPLRSSSL